MVNTTADDTFVDGRCSLREAIGAANSDAASGSDPGECPAGSGADAIVLDQATYSLSSPGVPGSVIDFSGDLDIQSPLTIDGAGAGLTTIDATNLCDRVMDVDSGPVLVRDLTITGGHAPDAPGSSPASEGGGIRNFAQALTLDHVTVEGNAAGSSAGGVGGATPTGGHGGDGGGIANHGGLTIRDSAVTTNRAGHGGPASARAGDGGSGGGVFNYNFASLTVLSSSVSGNTAGQGGDAGSGDSMATEIAGQGGDGGGIANLGTVQLNNVTVAGNDAGDGGTATPGGIAHFDGFGGDGGGIAQIHAESPSAATLTNITVADNRAGTAGGPRTSGAGGVGSAGGGLADRDGTTTLANTIVASNDVGGDCVGAPADAGGNLSFGGTGCPATFAIGDPLLGPLQDNGGPTSTMAIGAQGAAADMAIAGLCPATDQRGVSRPQGTQCDIGAFEVRLPDLSVGIGDAPDPVSRHGTLTYTITVRNAQGESAAADTVMTDPLPATIRFASYNATHGSCAVPRVGRSGTISCQLGALLPGDEAVITIDGAVSPRGNLPIENTASVTSSSPESDTANNTAATVTSVAR